MDIIISHEQGRVPITLIKLKGMLNLGTAHRLEQVAQEQYTSGMRFLIIDLSTVESLTSAGLRSIHIIYKMLKKELSTTDKYLPEQKSQPLKLVNPQPHVKRVLRISGFEDFTPVYTYLTEAINSF